MLLHIKVVEAYLPVANAQTHTHAAAATGSPYASQRSDGCTTSVYASQRSDQVLVASASQRQSQRHASSKAPERRELKGSIDEAAAVTAAGDCYWYSIYFLSY